MTSATYDTATALAGDLTDSSEVCVGDSEEPQVLDVQELVLPRRPGMAVLRVLA